MKFYGAKRWNDPRCWYDQRNNPTEMMLKKQGVELIQQLRETGLTNLSEAQKRHITRWLESCGGEACGSSLEMTGHDLRIVAMATLTQLPAGEAIVDWLNDPKNYAQLRKEWPGVDPEMLPNNRWLRYHTTAARVLFGARADYIPWGALTRDLMIDRLKQDCAITVCLTPPGHYVAIKVYAEGETDAERMDPRHDSFACNDSARDDGFTRWLTKAEEKTILPEAAVYWPKVS